MESQKIEFRTKAEEAEGLIESYKKERDETVHSLEVSNAKLRNMIDHSHLAASAFAKLVNERAYYKNLSEKAVEEGAEEGAEAGAESCRISGRGGRFRSCWCRKWSRSRSREWCRSWSRIS